MGDIEYQHCADAIAKIRAAFDGSVPGPASHKIVQIQDSCCTLRGACDDSIGDKAGTIEHLSKLYFSQSKHKSYNGGANSIKAEILHHLKGFENTLAERKTISNNNTQGKCYE